ncbi:MAG: aminotransferase class IV [Gemmataceae bacterium]|nr:aminotransferase class IV [Gemmataceae bacterium]
MSLVWVNGELVDKSAARVSPFDHGFLYGDGVWEPLRVFGGKLFRPADHLDLLWGSAGSIGLVIPHTRDELTAAIEATVRANHRTDGYVRVIVSRGPGTIGPDPRKLDPQVSIIAEEYQPFPTELYGHGLHAVVALSQLDPFNAAHVGRTLNQLHVVRAKQHALRNGCLEAVFYYTDNGVAGCTEGQLLIVRGRQVRWVYGGDYVAGDTAAGLASGLGYEVARGFARPEDLLAADELFIAGTSCGVIGIVRLEGRDIGSGTEGPVTRAVREAYRELTRGGEPHRPEAGATGLSTLPDEGGAE